MNQFFLKRREIARRLVENVMVSDPLYSPIEVNQSCFGNPRPMTVRVDMRIKEKLYAAYFPIMPHIYADHEQRESMGQMFQSWAKDIIEGKLAPVIHGPKGALP